MQKAPSHIFGRVLNALLTYDFFFGCNDHRCSTDQLAQKNPNETSVTKFSFLNFHEEIYCQFFVQKVNNQKSMFSCKFPKYLYNSIKNSFLQEYPLSVLPTIGFCYKKIFELARCWRNSIKISKSSWVFLNDVLL